MNGAIVHMIIGIGAIMVCVISWRRQSSFDKQEKQYWGMHHFPLYCETEWED